MHLRHPNVPVGVEWVGVECVGIECRARTITLTEGSNRDTISPSDETIKTRQDSTCVQALMFEC